MDLSPGWALLCAQSLERHLAPSFKVCQSSLIFVGHSQIA
jgi:hypothetical protein